MSDVETILEGEGYSLSRQGAKWRADVWGGSYFMSVPFMCGDAVPDHWRAAPLERLGMDARIHPDLAPAVAGLREAWNG